MKPWWTFDGGDLPGIGTYGINVFSGNLVIATSDMAIENPGVPLTFTRMYNSQSQHNVINSDNTQPSMIGNNWTCTFDAHIAQNSAGGISVFDADGAEYDYIYVGVGSNGTPIYNPPPGVHATLTRPSGTDYWWTQPDGSSMVFAKPTELAIHAGYDGRLVAQFGRNSQTYVNYTYSWANGNESSPENLTEIDAVDQSGRKASAMFAMFGSYDLIYQLIWPDRVTTVAYQYDTSGDLLSVTMPPTNIGGTAPVEVYAPSAGSLVVESPRYVSNPAQGGTVAFALNAANQVSYVQKSGVMDFVPNDGTNTPLHSASTAGTYMLYEQANVVISPGVSSVSDTSGHSNTYDWDNDANPELTGRVTQTLLNPGYSGPYYLSNSSSWDADNDVLSLVDTTGQETDFAYDSYGNEIADAQPYVSSLGFRPTELYSYDQNNNLLASCDPNFVNSRGLDWTSPPAASDSLCPSQVGVASSAGVCPAIGGATILTWTAETYEPFGELTASTSTCGVQTAISYNVGGQDLGLPTAVTGPTITQVDGTTRLTQESFQYDSYGDVTSLNTGSGTYSMVYDSGSLGRIVQATDPDGVSTYTCYNPDGSTLMTATAAQHANGANCSTLAPGTSSSYDVDGDEILTTEYFGNLKGQTQRWFDGADRLVEVSLPVAAGTSTNTGWLGYGAANFALPNADAFIGGSALPAWMQRYKYDLTVDGQPSDANNPEYGNLYVIQDYLWYITTNPNSFEWEESKAIDTDAIGRTTAEYQPQITKNTTTPIERYSYDGPGQAGYLSGVIKNGLSNSRAFTYDEIARATSQVTASSTNQDTETLQYDANSNVTAVGSSTYGVYSYTYDSVGNLLTKTEPVSIYNDMPSQFQFAYYADGLQSSLGVMPSPLSTSGGLIAPSLLQYAYRPDGLPSFAMVAPPFYAATDPVQVVGCLGYTYTAAGRLLSRTDPDSGGPSAGGNCPQSRRGTLQITRAPGAIHQSSIQQAGQTHVVRPTTPSGTSAGSGPLLARPFTPARANSLAPTGATNGSTTKVGAQTLRSTASLPATLPAATLVPLSLAYDSYGRVASEQLPANGQYSAFQYDFEDEVTQFSGYQAPSDPTDFPGSNAVNAYSVRGELSNQHYYPSSVTANFGTNFNASWPHVAALSITGLYLQLDFDTINPTQSAGIEPLFYANPGVEMSGSQTSGPWGGCPNYPVSYLSWSPDGAGRDSAGTAYTAANNIGQGCNPSDGGAFFNATASRTYDFDNHVLSATYPGTDYWPASGFSPSCDYSGNWPVFTDTSAAYEWGPEGHPIAAQYSQNGLPLRTTASGQPIQPVLHWVGDQLLFTTTGSGSVESIHAGTDLDLNSNQTYIVRDRDWTGSVVQSHDTTGESQWKPPSPFQLGCFQPSSPPMSSGYDQPQDPVFLQSDSNGYFDGFLEFQGDRTFDPQEGRFSTPDTEFGTLGDPESFHAFDWNRNNPESYSDPSGSDPIPITGPVTLSPICIWPCGQFGTVIDSGPPEGFGGGPNGAAGAYIMFVFNAVAGDDLAAIRNGHLPAWRRGLSVLSLASFAIPYFGEARGGLALLRAALKGAEVVEQGVYVYRDANGVIRYIGRSTQFTIRNTRHSVLRKQGLTMDRLYRTSDPEEQIAVEEALIRQYGLAKDGGQLLNKRNEIAFGTERWWRLMTTYSDSIEEAVPLSRGGGP
jgi:YD repeat-containing protein